MLRTERHRAPKGASGQWKDAVGTDGDLLGTTEKWPPQRSGEELVVGTVRHHQALGSRQHSAGTGHLLQETGIVNQGLHWGLVGRGLSTGHRAPPLSGQL